MTTEPIRMTEDVERMLALTVDHLDHRLRAVQFVLGAVLKSAAPLMDPELARYCHDALYPEDIVDGDGNVAAKNCQAPAPPVPTHWLRDMAMTGKSLAQVAGGRERAARGMPWREDVVV